MIVGVGVKHKDAVFAVTNPARHNRALEILQKVRPGAYREGPIEGFIDSHGKFLNRIDGAAYAIKCGQIKELRWPPELYSEDLW